ncbi:hypothetical protein SS1G_09865 [Sclerotinia sclerotiorum 1980 UF-70]|uniref:Ubiquitin-like domain-containing protein n=3 Tax=Sclerotinia TaxID=5179 RepID=A7EX06_SCLS1|nr:hypothetical protein SS1G_09865 [Sclerotinia sclerotiorum 1980 UF-70]EDN93998.1 hypothetical protein SS1G_09865 [Sclerotinia sclerotiorum 1980 UF-70]
MDDEMIEVLTTSVEDYWKNNVLYSPVTGLESCDQHYRTKFPFSNPEKNPNRERLTGNNRSFTTATMLIKVRTLTGKEIELDVESDNKIERVKEKVEEKEGIPPVQQRLIYGGKQMADDKLVKDYELEPGATLHLVLALRGGSL